jgi:hypothetical protein
MIPNRFAVYPTGSRESPSRPRRLREAVPPTSSCGASGANDKGRSLLVEGRLAAIRDALDTVTRVAGEDVRTAAAIEAAHDELTVIHAALLKVMERQP